MKLSNYFLPVLRELPKEAEIISHTLMLRCGMCQQASSGIYSWLPLGKKVLDNIEKITKEEMNLSGAVEILMPTIQSADIWQESGRYEDYGKEMLRISDRNKRELLFGPTNEELVTDIFRTHVKSYKELPLNLYHTQWKFRDELRPRFGVMRGREFLMKDAYSFDLDYNNSIKSYNKMFIAYLKLFKKMGLKALPMKADTGPIGGDLSHEFIIISNTGESNVYFDKEILGLEKNLENIKYNSDLQIIIDKYTSCYAATDEKHNEKMFTGKKENLIKTKGIEVGHIFHFGQKYSTPMNAKVTRDDGISVPVFMGSYGVGVSRLVGAIIESSHDEKGIIWPEQVAPFLFNLVNLKVGDKKCDNVCEETYNYLLKNEVDVLFDNKNESPGSKLARADLIGIPYQIIIGPNGVKEGIYDLKIRKTQEIKKLNIEQLFNFILNS